MKFVSLITDIKTQIEVEKRVPANARNARELSSRLTRPPPASYEELVRLLQPYAHKTVVIMGHIDPSADGSFVFEANGTKVSTSIGQLSQAAQEVEADLFAAGCNSADFAPVGTTTLVNSIDVVDAFGTLFSRGGKVSNGEFYRAVAGPRFPLAIDILAYQSFGRIGLQTQDGKDVGNFYRSTTSQGPLRSRDHPYQTIHLTNGQNRGSAVWHCGFCGVLTEFGSRLCIVLVCTPLQKMTTPAAICSRHS